MTHVITIQQSRCERIVCDHCAQDRARYLATSTYCKACYYLIKNQSRELHAQRHHTPGALEARALALVADLDALARDWDAAARRMRRPARDVRRLWR